MPRQHACFNAAIRLSCFAGHFSGQGRAYRKQRLFLEIGTSRRSLDSARKRWHSFCLAADAAFCPDRMSLSHRKFRGVANWYGNKPSWPVP
jgi:hypothetical protein